MRRTTLYSSSATSRVRTPARSGAARQAAVAQEARTAATGASRDTHGTSATRTRAASAPAAGAAASAAQVAAAPAARHGIRGFLARYERFFLVASGAAVALLAAWMLGYAKPPSQRLTQEDIDAAVMHTLRSNPLPSFAAKAYEVVKPSVVKVRGFMSDAESDPLEESGQGVGTGVVVVDKGVILTNLHVVVGAKRVRVVFDDGTESEARVIGARPEQDLAILQARTVPDDLVPATLGSSRGLNVGDNVIAVGYPFGIGPTATAGVVSGLNREFRSPEGQRMLTNLIQFDAAANPGSSGGPLVTAEGEVIGIVTGILNPTGQRVFVGIGFAVPIESAAGAAGLPPF